MKKIYFIVLVCSVVVCAAIALAACTSSDGVITKTKDGYTINTTSLSQDVKGYNGPTPLLITVKKDRIVKVEALENNETPRFFKHMTDAGILERWNGMTIDEALNADVDVVAGATFSSNAVIENVRLGLNYYKQHK